MEEQQGATARTHQDRVRALVEMATQADQHKTITVELPDATERLRLALGPDEPPFTVTFRPMKLDEMIELGDLPPVLMQELDDFNTQMLVFQLEASQEEGESEEHFNKRSVAAALREQGAMRFMSRTRALRDATISICSLEPKIMPSVLEIDNPEVQMAITHFTSKDRDLMHREIQKATGEMTTEELRSFLDADSTETTDADLEEVTGPSDDPGESSLPDGMPE